MMVLALAVLSIACFLAAFWLLRVVPVASKALATVHQAAADLRDPALDDEAREKAARQGALFLFGSFASILWRSLAALAAALVPIYAGDFLGLASGEAVFAFLARWEVIVAATAVICAGFYVKGRLWPGR